MTKRVNTQAISQLARWAKDDNLLEIIFHNPGASLWLLGRLTDVTIGTGKFRTRFFEFTSTSGPKCRLPVHTWGKVAMTLERTGHCGPRISIFDKDHPDQGVTIGSPWGHQEFDPVVDQLARWSADRADVLYVVGPELCSMSVIGKLTPAAPDDYFITGLVPGTDVRTALRFRPTRADNCWVHKSGAIIAASGPIVCYLIKTKPRISVEDLMQRLAVASNFVN